MSRRGLLRGAAGIAGGLILAGCGTTARSLGSDVPAVPNTPLPQPASTITPLPRFVPTQTSTVTLTMRAGSFSPRTLAVAPGTVIRVVNADGEMHSLMPAEYEQHQMRSSDVGPGNTVHMTAPDTPGEYKYTCLYHSWIAEESGTIIVTPDAASATTLNEQNGVDTSGSDTEPIATSGFTPGNGSTSSPTSTSTPRSTSSPSSTPTSTAGSDDEDYEED